MRCGPQCPPDHDTGLGSTATRVLGHTLEKLTAEALGSLRSVRGRRSVDERQPCARHETSARTFTTSLKRSRPQVTRTFPGGELFAGTSTTCSLRVRNRSANV